MPIDITPPPEILPVWVLSPNGAWVSFSTGTMAERLADRDRYIRDHGIRHAQVYEGPGVPPRVKRRGMR